MSSFDFLTLSSDGYLGGMDDVEFDAGALDSDWATRDDVGEHKNDTQLEGGAGARQLLTNFDFESKSFGDTCDFDAADLCFGNGFGLGLGLLDAQLKDSGVEMYTVFEREGALSVQDKPKRKYTKRKMNDEGVNKPANPASPRKRGTLVKSASADMTDAFAAADFLLEEKDESAPAKVAQLKKSKSAPLTVAGSEATAGTGPESSEQGESCAETTASAAAGNASDQPEVNKKNSKKKATSADGADEDGETSLKQTSAFRGVSCCGKDRKWQARIRDANRVLYLGRFGTEVEAAFVYDDAARQLKGDRAPTNFIRMDPVTKDSLKAAFIANGNQVPASHVHFVVRSKSKGSSSKSPKNATACAQPPLPPTAPFSEFPFPDSPVAKLKLTAAAPPIQPPAKSFAQRSDRAPLATVPGRALDSVASSFAVKRETASP